MATRLDLPPPPAFVRDPGGGGSDWVELVTAANDIDAHLLAGVLHEAGIETRSVRDRHAAAWLYGGSDPWAPVAIWVRRFQYEDSRIVLAELSMDGPPAIRHTPESSSQQASPSRRAAVTWWIAALVLGLLLTGIALARSAEYIERCGFTAQCEPRGVMP